MNCSPEKTSELHSVVFKTDPPNMWTTTSARKWLKDKDITRLKGVDITKNSLRYRIVDPKCFRTFSTEVVQGSLGTINLVIGWYKPQRKKRGGILKIPKSKPIQKNILNKSSRNALKRKRNSKGGVIFSSRLNGSSHNSSHY